MIKFIQIMKHKRLDSFKANRKIVTIILLSFILLSPYNFTEAQIYYGSNDQVIISNRNGSDTTLIYDDRPESIAVDKSNGYIYWSETVYHDEVRRAKLDGSGMETIFGKNNYMTAPEGIALDTVNQKIYLADLNNNGMIFSFNTDGSSLDTLVVGKKDGATDGIYDIALDVPNNKMYWVKTGAVMRADLDGGNVEEFVKLKSYIQPSSIAVNSRDGFVYWVNTSNKDIMKASIKTGQAEKLLHADAPFGLALSLKQGKIYWVNSFFSVGNDGKIYRANLDGSDAEQVLDIGAPSGAIFVDNFNLTSAKNVFSKNSVPNSLKLMDNYPNPFNPQTTIKYSIPKTSRITLQIFNSLGQLVQTLIDNKVQAAGWHKEIFSGANLSSGVYYYRVRTGANTFTKKMVLLK